MRYLLLVIIGLVLSISILKSQDEWGYTLYGYVKTDVMLDTRQTVTAREGHLLLYPDKKLEANGVDANEGINFNILSIQSRFGAKIKAPDFLGAKSSGIMEAEFFGSSNAVTGGVRLRVGVVKLDWGSHEFMAGQNWTPLFIEEAFAKTISFNTGVPFVAFGRSPQVRYTYKPGKFKLHLSALSERDFQSTGPAGETSSYLRNAGLPMLNLGANYDDGTIFLAANASYKEVRPRLITDGGTIPTKVIDENKAKGFVTNILARYTATDFFVTASALYGQNTHNLLMIGGYAVKSVSADNGMWEYTPINTGSGWIDMQYGKDLTVGFFGGYTKNLGAEDEITGSYYSRGRDIDYVYRASPRISYRTGKTQLAAEFEYTTAAYGTNDKMGKVINSQEVANLRVLLAAIIYF